jgi:DNA-binding MarR family transcriptional regulator
VPLDDRAVFLLSQLGHNVADRFAQALAPLGIKPAHFGILTHLRAADGRSQQQLADLLDIHRNPMVGLVDELEALGLVRRTRHPDDRRAHAVHLTEQARSVLDEGDRIADALEATILESLDADERRQLLATLRKVAAHAALPVGVHPGLRRRSPRPGAAG